MNGLAVACCLLLAAAAAAPGWAREPEALPADLAVSALCDKRIALLGELPSHGEARAFEIKAAIVRALVQRCGFDAVLFEAPIYDFVGLESRWAKDASRRQLDDAIGRFWWAKELAPWRSWLFDEAAAGRLVIGGIDDQLSATSELARAALPGLVAAHASGAEAGACRAAVERHLHWSYDDQHPLDDAEKRLLFGCARSAAASSAAGSESTLLGNFAGYVARQVQAKAAPDRDGAMARNLDWYLGKLPAGSKLVVWTATVHGAKAHGDLRARPMGSWLAEKWGAQVGSVGFTALSGKSSMAGRPPVAMTFAAPDSLEARLLQTGQAEAWIGADQLRELGVIESRLYGKFVRADWSTRFDGVIVVREEVPPVFEKPYPD